MATHFSGPVYSTGGVRANSGAFQTIAGDGAITVPETDFAFVLLTKGSAAAITIGVPTTADNGKMIAVHSSTAFAHVITQSTVGFNAKGSSGTATAATPFTGLLLLVAQGGNWYTFGQNLWTIA